MRLLLIGFLTVASFGQAQDPVEILRKYIDTVSNGDVENWKRITSIYMESIGGYSQDNFTGAKPDFDLMPPTFTRTFTIMPYETKIEVYEDSTCMLLLSKFHYSRDKMVIFVGNLPPIEKPMKRESDESQFPSVTVSNLVRKAKTIKLIGIKDFVDDSTSCYEIEVETKDITERLYVNNRTYLLEYTSLSKEGAYQGMNRYGGYKKFGNLLIPTKVVSSRKDTSTGKNVPFHWMHIRKLILNEPIDEKEFRYKLEPIR